MTTTESVPAIDTHSLLHESTAALMARASVIRDRAHGTRITFSPKVFIPVTFLCNDTCGYCTFAQPPARVDKLFLDPDDVLRIARQGARNGCHEALFTLGERPEDRYEVARRLAARAGLRLDGALRRRDGPARAQGDRPAPPRQRRRVVRRRTRTAPTGQPQPGDDDRVAEPRPRSTPQRAGQDTRATPRHARGGRGAVDPVHHRDPRRHRREPSRSARSTRSDRRQPPTPRTRPGGDRPELPAQAPHGDARGHGLSERRLPVGDRRGPGDPAGRHPSAGAAEPVRRLRRAPRRRASTTGAASHRSRPTTSTPSGRGPTSTCSAT